MNKIKWEHLPSGATANLSHRYFVDVWGFGKFWKWWLYENHVDEFGQPYFDIIFKCHELRFPTIPNFNHYHEKSNAQKGFENWWHKRTGETIHQKKIGIDFGANTYRTRRISDIERNHQKK